MAKASATLPPATRGKQPAKVAPIPTKSKSEPALKKLAKRAYHAPLYHTPRPPRPAQTERAGTVSPEQPAPYFASEPVKNNGKERIGGSSLHVGIEPIRTQAERQTAFLAALEVEGTLSDAARVSGVSRVTHYNWLNSDPTYQDRFRASFEKAVDTAERELRRRGVAGYDKPVFYQGEQTGTIREYSDACLIFYLKGRRGDVFRDRAEISGPGGGPIEHSMAVDVSAIPLDRLRQMRAWMLEAARTTLQPALGTGDSAAPIDVEATPVPDEGEGGAP